MLPAVSQPRGYSIDGELDTLHHAGVGVPGTITLQQLKLHVI